MIKSKEELMSAVNQSLLEVREILKKSGIDMPMRKEDDPDEIAGQAAGGEGAPPPSAEGAMPPGAEGGMPPAEGAPPGEGEAMQAEGAEGAEGGMPPAEGAEGAPQQTTEEEMAQHAQNLSPEELDMMLNALMAEKERRGAESQPAEGAGAPPAAAPAPAPEMAEKSMKTEFSSLAKSLEAIARAVSGLKGEVEGLKKSQQAAATKKSVVTARPCATNEVQVLQKSTTAVERLSKSETETFLLNLQRNGDKLVNSRMVADVTGCQTDAELHAVQRKLERSGVKFPTAS